MFKHTFHQVDKRRAHTAIFMPFFLLYTHSHVPYCCKSKCSLKAESMLWPHSLTLWKKEQSDHGLRVKILFGMKSSCRELLSQLLCWLLCVKYQFSGVQSCDARDSISDSLEAQGQYKKSETESLKPLENGMVSKTWAVAHENWKWTEEG